MKLQKDTWVLQLRSPPPNWPAFCSFPHRPWWSTWPHLLELWRTNGCVLCGEQMGVFYFYFFHPLGYSDHSNSLIHFLNSKKKYDKVQMSVGPWDGVFHYKHTCTHTNLANMLALKGVASWLVIVQIMMMCKTRVLPNSMHVENVLFHMNLYNCFLYSQSNPKFIDT